MQVVVGDDRRLPDGRENLGGLVDAYREVAQRLGILTETDNALSTGPRLVQ